MKRIITLFVLAISHILLRGQVMEAVGIPTANTPVSSYTGWSNTNTSIVSFSGNAEVQNQESCTIPASSAGGNVLLNNVANTYFDITYSLTIPANAQIGIDFSLRNYNAATPNEMALQCSINNGPWMALGYQPYSGNVFLYETWNYFTSTSFYGFGSNTNTTITFRFTQTATTKQFRLDDIYLRIAVPLPIVLNNFTGSLNNDGILLKWNANSTNAADVFVIEKSSDGKKFSTINTQQSQVSGTASYTFKDVQLINDKTYYRLLMKDVEGKKTYSSILSINSKEKLDKKIIVGLFPSPASSNMNLNIMATTDCVSSLEIYNSAGVKVKAQSSSLSKGTNTVSVNVSSLKAGNYILKLNINGQIESKSFVVVHLK